MKLKRPKLTGFQCEASINPLGQLQIQDIQGLRSWSSSVPAGTVLLLSLDEVEDVRSLRANGYYWGVVLRIASQETGHTADELHETFKAMFLPDESKMVELISKLTGETFSCKITLSTATLGREAFRQFVEQVREYLAQHLNIITPDPDPLWWARGQARRSA